MANVSALSSGFTVKNCVVRDTRAKGIYKPADLEHALSPHHGITIHGDPTSPFGDRQTRRSSREPPQNASRSYQHQRIFHRSPVIPPPPPHRPTERNPAMRKLGIVALADRTLAEDAWAPLANLADYYGAARKVMFRNRSGLAAPTQTMSPQGMT